MRIRQGLFLYWPLVMAGAFLVPVFLLCWTLYSTRLDLRAATDTRLQSDSVRRATVIADFLSNQKNLVGRLATGHEIDDFLSNRALGMSRRYGLNANLDAIERRFQQTIVQTSLHGESFLRRISFVDANNVDIATAGVSDGALPARPPSDAQTMRMVSNDGAIEFSAPVFFKDRIAGAVVAVTDPRALSRLLIEEGGAEDFYHELIIVGSGDHAIAPDSSTLDFASAGRLFAGLPENTLTKTGNPANAGASAVLVQRTPIPGAPLSLVTITSESAAYGRLASPASVLSLAAFPVILFLVAIGFERQRRRAMRLQNDIAESDRRRDELSRHNSDLSQEIARRKALEEDLRLKTDTLNASNADLRIAATTFEAQEGMLVTDANRRILRVNSAFSELSGYAGDELVGQSISIFRSRKTPQAIYAEMMRATSQNGRWQGEMWLRTKSGKAVEKWLTISAVRDEGGSNSHYVGTYYDLTERRKAEEKIKELAFYDQLTGLPNRSILIERARQVVKSCRDTRSYAALLFVDLDHFKRLNDTLGHHKGDMLLKQSAVRLKDCTTSRDTVSRFGGDEFVILLSDLGASEVTSAALQAKANAEEIIAALSAPQDLDGFSFRCTASVGVALFHDDSQTIDDLLKRADMAMYEAKTAGRNAVRFFDPAMQTLVESRASIEATLRDDIAAKKFLLHYQPQVDEESRLLGAEALLRWPHEDWNVSPAEIVAVAESSGLMVALGDGVLETACNQLAEWSRYPAMAGLSIAVNVSGVQLHDPTFVDRVVNVIARTGADPYLLKLEVTESIEISKIEEVMGKMTKLREYGIRFSLDDFGTGYSSLSYLKRLPIDQLKIDQSFVRDILVDPNDAAIAATIIALGDTLGLAVIAEGVETHEQRALLESQGCRGFQGYLFGRPVPPDQFVELAKVSRVAPSQHVRQEGAFAVIPRLSA